MTDKIVQLAAKLMVKLWKGLLVDWQHRLRTLFAGIILYQFSIWFDVYWMSATTWIVTGALVVTWLVESFPRIHYLIRCLLESAAIVALAMYRLDVDFAAAEQPWFGGALGAVGDAVSAFALALADTLPYLWFGIGAWIVYLISIEWLKERARIVLYVVLAVLAFAIVDSYSKHIFWDQVALIVFSGLGLIIIEHFEHFRRKHPVSWSYLSEYPWTIALPIILIVTSVMIVGTFAPNARPVLTDPYTAYKNWKGERVVTGGKGFSSPVASSLAQLSVQSGYGRDDSTLGGGFNFDYTEVMRVESSQRTYYRGETKSLYTGAGWELSEADMSAGEGPVALEQQLPAHTWDDGVESDAIHTVGLEQTFYMTDEPEYPVLFGAHPIQSVDYYSVDGEARTGGIGGLAWSPRQAELRYTGEAEYPAVYTVTSSVAVIDEQTLRQVGDYDFTSGQWADYLQLPASVSARVHELAAKVTADGESLYEKAKLLEAYLQSNFDYNNRPNLARGRSEDFVERFLFEMEEGYCDYFSTAMAVMARTLGIPSRWVKGYTSGILDVDMYSGLPEDIIAQMDESKYVVRNADAHSWVELFIPGAGWLAFEPTNGFLLPVYADTSQPEAAPVAQPELTPNTLEQEGDERGVSAAGGVAIAAAAFAAVAAAAWLLLRRGGWRKLLAFVRFRRKVFGINQRALHEVGQIIRLFRRKGYTRNEHETARESFARWIARNQWLKADLDVVLGILEKARYSGQEVSGDDMTKLLKTKQRLREELQ